MNRISRLLTLGILIPFGLIHAQWPEPTSTNKPWTRWWWHGSAVEKSEITRELESFAEAGLGGVEITPIFGVQGFEANEMPFLSAEWLDMMKYACLEAKRLGMQVDIVPGTGWRLGNEFVPEEERAVRLKLVTEKIDGERKYSALTELSGERVKRPALGGGGYTLDMLNHDAVQHHLDWFYGKFFKTIPPELVRGVFHDSWEYNTNWSHDFESEFRRRRGMDISGILPMFDPENRSYSSDTVEGWRYSYRQTLEELLLENFCGTWSNSAHELGLLSRNQGHGSIANLLDVYAMADIPETEIFRDHETFLVHKFASSAAHVSGKQLVSSESFTWLSEHWKSDLAKLKRFTDYLFLCGTNHILFHGTAYSPDEATWPGWVFYASTQLNDRNPLWNHLPALNDYITRSQSLLQSGQPYTEAYLYWPIADLYAEKPGTKIRLHISGEDWLEGSSFERTAQQLWDKGVHFDYISDRQLQQLAQSDEPVPPIILPPLNRIPLETLESLVLLAQKGVEVSSLDPAPNWKVPGGLDGRLLQSRLEELLVAATRDQSIRFAKDVSFMEIGSDGWQAGSDMRCVRRILDDGSHLYFIVNRSDHRNRQEIPLADGPVTCERLDPWTGEIRKVKLSTEGRLDLALDPRSSTFVRIGGKNLLEVFPVSEPEEEILVLNNSWTLKFARGGPELPEPIQLNELDWISKLGDSRLNRFAGLMRFENSFDFSSLEAANNLFIDLGELSSSAQVFLNGELIGTSIQAPHMLSIPKKVLRQGVNQLVIEIATLADNRIRYLDRSGTTWRIFKDINFRSLEHGEFDASDWPVSNYGLKGPVRLLSGN